jgi:hypothetical protein
MWQIGLDFILGKSFTETSGQPFLIQKSGYNSTRIFQTFNSGNQREGWTTWTAWSTRTQRRARLSGPVGKSRCQSYDLWLYNYNASVAVYRPDRFLPSGTFFCFKNGLGYSWCCRFLQSWRCHSQSYAVFEACALWNPSSQFWYQYTEYMFWNCNCNMPRYY